MKIRKAKKGDFKEIAEIMMRESSRKPYRDKYTIKIALKEINQLAKKELYIAEDNKKIFGFIASRITSDNKKKAYIDELWLKRIYQGKGVGKTLVRFIEEKYKKKGVNIIRLISKKNAKAFGFYQKIKYKEYKDMVFMEKKLK